MHPAGHARAERLIASVIVATVAAAVTLAAQESKSSEIAPAELVRATVENEIAASNHPEGLHMFRSYKKTPKGSQTRLYVETKDALAAKLIAINDQPLTAEQQQTEANHLTWLMNNPEQLRKKAVREKEDEERSLRIVRALPDAFCYEYAGTENSAAGLGKAGNQLIKLKFTPNPAYRPPSRVEEVLAGMQGVLLIDPEVRRLARIEGTLFREVTFGWGIIGHLNKGGQFRVQQADLGLGDGAWGVTDLNLNITGKILMIKGISMISDEVLSDFQKMPEDLSFAEGVGRLKMQEEKQAHDNRASENLEVKKAQSN
jgi:hypothetical protein